MCAYKKPRKIVRRARTLLLRAAPSCPRPRRRKAIFCENAVLLCSAIDFLVVLPVKCDPRILPLPSRLLLLLPTHLPIQSTRARSTCWPPNTAQYPGPSLLFSPKRGATMRRSDRRKRGQTTTDFPIRRTPSCRARRARRASFPHVRYDAMYVHMYVSLSSKKTRAPGILSARESEENRPIRTRKTRVERGDVGTSACLRRHRAFYTSPMSPLCLFCFFVLASSSASPHRCFVALAETTSPLASS